MGRGRPGLPRAGRGEGPGGRRGARPRRWRGREGGRRPVLRAPGSYAGCCACGPSRPRDPLLPGERPGASRSRRGLGGGRVRRVWRLGRVVSSRAPAAAALGPTPLKPVEARRTPAQSLRAPRGRSAGGRRASGRRGRSRGPGGGDAGGASQARSPSRLRRRGPGRAGGPRVDPVDAGLQLQELQLPRPPLQHVVDRVFLGQRVADAVQLLVPAPGVVGHQPAVLER